MEFKWDSTKAESNLRKHGMAFELAINVFSDPERTISVDSRLNYEEERFITTGEIAGRLCVIVYTERGNTIRIISARKANKRELRRHDNR